MCFSLVLRRKTITIGASIYVSIRCECAWWYGIWNWSLRLDTLRVVPSSHKCPQHSPPLQPAQAQAAEAPTEWVFVSPDNLACLKFELLSHRHIPITPALFGFTTFQCSSWFLGNDVFHIVLRLCAMPWVVRMGVHVHTRRAPERHFVPQLSTVRVTPGKPWAP